MKNYSRREILRRLSAGAGLTVGAGLIGPSVLLAEEDPFMLAQEAQGLMGQKKYKEAIKKLELALKSEPGNDWYLDMLAKAYIKDGDKAGAIKVYQDLIKADPDNWIAKAKLDILTQTPVKLIFAGKYHGKKL